MKTKIEIKGRKRPIFRGRAQHLFTDLTSDYEHRKSNVTETVPGDAYTIQELMKRHQAGMLTDVGKDIFYTEDVDSQNFGAMDLSKISNLDLFEAEQMAAENRRTIEELDTKVKQRKAAARSARAQKLLEEARKLMKEEPATNDQPKPPINVQGAD